MPDHCDDAPPGRGDAARTGAFRDLVTDIATSLSSVPFMAVDTALQEALERLGRFTGVDRSYIFLLHEDDPTRCDNTHEWYAAGIVPQIDNLQDIPLAPYADIVVLLERGEAWCCPDVAALPDEMAFIRNIFLQQAIRSLVLVPMHVGDEFLGFVGFDWVRRHEPAVETMVPLLRIAGGIIAQTVHRYRQHRRLLDHQRRLQELVQAMHRQERVTRRRLAEALHDGLAQELAALKLEIQMAARDDVPLDGERIDRLVSGLERCLARTRDLTFELYPSTLRRGGLLAALRELAEHLAGSPDFRLLLELPEQEPDLDEDLRAELFLAARELVHNARKHSGVAEAVLRVSRDGDTLQLTVSDRGRGFDPADLEHEAGFRHGFGLASIRERLGERGGHLEIASARGAGTVVNIACRCRGTGGLPCPAS